MYHSVVSRTGTRFKGRDKKVTVTEADHFWLNGVPVRRVLRKNGKDLTPEERAKEDERLEKQTQKARERREAKDDARVRRAIPRATKRSLCRGFLSSVHSAIPGAIELDGADRLSLSTTLATHTRRPGIAQKTSIRDMAGTAWVDEQDKVLVRVEGHFVRAVQDRRRTCGGHQAGHAFHVSIRPR